jgi:hypothetical protein
MYEQDIIIMKLNFFFFIVYAPDTLMVFVIYYIIRKEFSNKENVIIKYLVDDYNLWIGKL